MRKKVIEVIVVGLALAWFVAGEAFAEEVMMQGADMAHSRLVSCSHAKKSSTSYCFVAATFVGFGEKRTIEFCEKTKKQVWEKLGGSGEGLVEYNRCELVKP